MDYQYNASEFSMVDSAAWNPTECTQTEQFARNGASDWETIRMVFADEQSPPRWQWQTPKETGVLSGPLSIPLLGLPVISVAPPLTPALTTPLQLVGPANAIREAFVVTYGQGAQGKATIDQGQSDSQGWIWLLGVRDRDVARALSHNGIYSGQTTLTAGITNTLLLTRSFAAASRADGAPRYLRLLPHASGRGLEVQVSGIGPGASLDAHLDLTGRANSTGQVMGYSGLKGEYRATLTPAFADASATLDGLGQVWIGGADVDGQPVYLAGRAAFYSLQPGVGRYLASPDGHLRLSLPIDAAPETGVPVRLLVGEQNSFGALSDRAFLSPVYEVGLGGALPGFAAPVTLAIHAGGEQRRASGQPLIARFDEETRQWQTVTTGWDRESRVASIPIRNGGFYALAGGQVAPELQLFLPHIQN